MKKGWLEKYTAIRLNRQGQEKRHTYYQHCWWESGRIRKRHVSRTEESQLLKELGYS
ncbi:MAG: hypothetical protein HC818_00115 [Synechococcaceae cyanobacterium RM1_1_27]|nr:hypothetical protein [Synechococcaceae cyanobacterium RM1_1_27]